jgi:protease II
VDYPQEENWKELVTGDENNQILNVDYTNYKLVVKYSDLGAEYYKIFRLTSHEDKAVFIKEVRLPGRGQIEDEFGGDYDENFYLFSYQTYT